MVKLCQLRTNLFSLVSGRNFLAVVAIDLGSSFSGYAYQYTDDHQEEPTKNILFHSWPENDSAKTLSTLLLNPDASLKSFG